MTKGTLLLLRSPDFSRHLIDCPAPLAQTSIQLAQRTMDTLSDVLKAVRLKGAMFFLVDAYSPWAAEAPPAQVIAAAVMPGSEHVIEFHVITEGSCYGYLIGGEAVRL